MLSDLRVLDLTDKKGWFCGTLLADMGAEVIRLEKPGSPDTEEYNNAGKKLITLDIEYPQGRELFKKLIERCQVLIESYTPGYLQSMGLDYIALKLINPDLIMVSITPFGQSGPQAKYKSSALTAAAAGGQLFLNGDPNQPPLQLVGPQAYLIASLFAANGVLLALQWHHQSGSGQYLDISIQECVAGTLDHALVRYWYDGEIASRCGDLYWNKAFKILPCRDGQILISFNQNWQTLLDWLDSEGMAQDLQQDCWKDADYRLANLEHIFEVLRKWTLTHDAEELVETAQLMRLPWAKVASLEDVMQNPQLKERGYFVETVDPQTGKTFRFPGAPVKMSASPWKVNTHISMVGEGNREVYQGILGLSDTEIEKLKTTGVI